MAADPPFDPEQQGISLSELAEAFAQVMGTTPRRQDADEAARLEGNEPDERGGESESAASPELAVETESGADDACPISPRTIVEAMLFVGNRDGQPLTARRAAELMRDVGEEEIPALIDELNRQYEAMGTPYYVVNEVGGYRLVLREEMRPLQNRFFGRVREARLSQAAVDVLALVAYEQPITGEKISQLRGKPSGHVVNQLVRRGLLRVERPDPKKRTAHYRTTDRFLQLFSLDSLEDLPRDDSAPP